MDRTTHCGVCGPVKQRQWRRGPLRTAQKKFACSSVSAWKPYIFMALRNSGFKAVSQVSWWWLLQWPHPFRNGPEARKRRDAIRFCHNFTERWACVESAILLNVLSKLFLQQSSCWSAFPCLEGNTRRISTTKRLRLNSMVRADLLGPSEWPWFLFYWHSPQRCLWFWKCSWEAKNTDFSLGLCSFYSYPKTNKQDICLVSQTFVQNSIPIWTKILTW